MIRPPVAAAQSADLPPPGRLQRYAERELVRRREQHRLGSVEPTKHGPARVNRQRPQRQALSPGNTPVPLVPVVLDRERGRPTGAQCFAQQLQPLGESRADHDAVRGDRDAAGAGQVAGQRGAQLRQTARIGVAEGPARRRGQRLPGRRQPARRREGRHVRHPGAQVIPGPAGQGRGGRGGGGRRRRGAFRDPRSRSLPGRQPAFGDQLAVGLGDRVPGDAEVGGKCPGGREPGTWQQPPAAHGLPQRRLKAGAHPRAGQVEMQVKPGSAGPGERPPGPSGNGPRFCHRTGPYSWAASLLVWIPTTMTGTTG